jgi:hypothetical protein
MTVLSINAKIFTVFSLILAHFIKGLKVYKRQNRCCVQPHPGPKRKELKVYYINAKIFTVFSLTLALKEKEFRVRGHI